VAKNKSIIGFVGGIVLACLIWGLPLEGLTPEGKKCLALSMLTVVWWAMSVAHPGYVSLFLLGSYVVLGVAPGNVVFGLWASPLVYLVVGGYLIASAVRDSGLGKRIAYLYILRYINSYNSIVVGAYVLGFLLSFLIPHPWPRSFLIMSVMAMIIRSANLPLKDAANIGLAVFAGSAPTSTILLTGDSIINVVTVGMSGANVSWLGWLWYMGVPGLIASALTLGLQLFLYKPTCDFNLDKAEIAKNLKEMGSLTPIEKRCLFWVGLAIVAWVTDSLHHLHPGWVALYAAIAMSLPRVGAVLKPTSWNDVPIATLFFLTAALAIGKVGDHAGMNQWLAAVLLPSHAPANPFLFAGFVSLIAVAMHMCLGSVMAVMGIAIPTLITFGATSGLPPLVPALLVYTAISIHFVLPFHHMNVLVGLGDKQGMYGDREVIRLGLPLTGIVFITTMLVQIPWWKLIGLL
jgi:anion transporter